MPETKKMTPSQRARLGGLAAARSLGKAGTTARAMKGGAAVVEKHGKEHMLRLALRRRGYAVKLGTEKPTATDTDCPNCTPERACEAHLLYRRFQR